MQHPNKLDRRARFARAAVYMEFRSRDARAISQGNFRDRAPNARCRPTTFTTGPRKDSLR